MTTLVTGSTGLLGNNVVRQLLAQGEAVRVLVRSSSDPRPLEGLEVETVQGDVCDADSVRRAAEGVSTIIHSAAHVHIGWQQHARQQKINVEGTRTVALAAREAGARMIHVSTTDTCGFGTLDAPADEETPLTPGVDCPYVVTKRAAEKVVLDLVGEGLDGVIVNPSFMLGPWDWKPSSGRMLLQVARGWALVAPRGENNFCDVRDVARGVLAAVKQGKPGRRYILGGESLSYLEAWQIFAAVSGSRPPLGQARQVPVMMLAAGRFGDVFARLTGREPAVNSAAVAMSRLSKCCTHARAAAELGYQAGTVRDAARDAWDWFRQYGYAR